jgi:hypothetical protein
MQVTGQTVKTGDFDYAGLTGAVTLPAMPPGVTLTVIDIGLTPPPSSPNTGPLVFVGLLLAGIIVGLAVSR